MKYSIIMPVYMKDPAHLEVVEEAVHSIFELAPNLSDYELIMIDDGSPFPATFEIAAQTAHEVIVHKTNKGIAASWNTGIQAAKGEYICIVNDDISVHNANWLDKMRQALEMEDEYMVSAPGVVGQSNGTGIEENYKWFPGYCFMLKRETIGKIGLFDEQFSPFNYEDTDYWTRILQAGGKLVRNYNTMITHIGGHVLHTLKYDEVSETNKQKFITKHGFDPIPVFYGEQEFPL